MSTKATESATPRFARLAMTVLLIVVSIVSQGGAAPSGESLYQGDWVFTDQEGKKLKLDVYRGHPVVVSMFYASCPYTCPLIIDSLRKKIENRVDRAVRERMRVLLITFDPKRDTPKKLKELATARSFDLNRWKLLTGSESVIRDIAAVLGVKYRSLPDGEFHHSSVIILLDADGVIRASIDGLNQSFSLLVDTLKQLQH